MTARNLARILKQIVKERQWRLLFCITAIDVDFFTNGGAPLVDGQGHTPHPLFDHAFYRVRYLQDKPGIQPFCHYLSTGFKKGYKPGPFFDPDVYREQTDWLPEQGNPLVHYLEEGRFQGARPGVFFDIEWYLDRTPVLHEIRTEALSHYRIHGAGEGKSPIPVFDPGYYLGTTGDSAEAGVDPLSHYLMHGADNDARPSAWFDPAYYREKYLAGLKGSLPLEHYLRQGVWQGNYTDRRVEQLSARSVISVVVPVYNPNPSFLNNCVRSVLYQTYPHWELCLVDDGSTREDTRLLLEAWAQKDSRIKVAFLSENSGIAVATNKAIALAGGEYIGFLDNDDELTPDCLYHVVETLNGSKAEMIYTDEELIGDDGRSFSTFLKPDYNPELLLSHNYITHFVVASKLLLQQLGGLRSACDGAQDFDLMLRLSEKTDKITHINRVLYRWRATETSTSVNHGQKHYAHAAGKKALAESLARRNIEADVEETGINFYYRTRHRPSAMPRVAVLFWDETDRHQVADCRILLRKTTYTNGEFRLISPSRSRLISAVDGSPEGDCQVESFSVKEPAAAAGKAQRLHQVIAATQADYIALVDLPLSDLDGAWIDELLGWMQLGENGMVCGRVSYEGSDGTSFATPDTGDDSVRYYFDFLHQASRHLHGLHCTQQVSCAGWDVCLFSRETYLALGGFNFREFPFLFAIIDLSFRMVDSGRRIVYTPYARVTKPLGLDSDCRASGGDRLKSEKLRFQDIWRARLQRSDVFYNTGQLTLNNIAADHFFAWRCGGQETGKP